MDYSNVKKLSGVIVGICKTITDATGSITAFVIVMLWLVYLYILLPIQGFAKWNSGIGLFGNTNGSNVELITGVGSVLLLNLGAKKAKQHHEEMKKLASAHHQEVRAFHQQHTSELAAMEKRLQEPLSFINRPKLEYKDIKPKEAS